MTTLPNDLSEPIIFVNGGFTPQSQARISVMDHGLLYGDGVFDTALACNGRIFKLQEHIDRTWRSMAAIGLTPPMDQQALRALLIEAININNLRNAYLKWIVTRGSNGRALMDPSGCDANLIIIALPYRRRWSGGEGLRLKTTAIRRPSGQVIDPQIKSLNYLNLVLAKLEAKAANADDSLMLDLHGRLCEAPGSNVILVRDGRLMTPAHDVLQGVTRDTVMGLAKDRGLRPEYGDYELYDAYCAEELFLCSTAGGLSPVTTLDGRPIGDGRPGPVFSALAADYDDLIASDRFGALCR